MEIDLNFQNLLQNFWKKIILRHLGEAQNKISNTDEINSLTVFKPR